MGILDGLLDDQFRYGGSDFEGVLEDANNQREQRELLEEFAKRLKEAWWHEQQPPQLEIKLDKFGSMKITKELLAWLNNSAKKEGKKSTWMQVEKAILTYKIK